MDVDNKNCPRGAEELLLCGVWFASVVAGFQHPRVSMRPGDDSCRPVVLRAVHESANRVVAVPDARLAAQAVARISVQGLLAMPRPNSAREDSRPTDSIAEDMPHGCQDARV